MSIQVYLDTSSDFQRIISDEISRLKKIESSKREKNEAKLSTNPNIDPETLLPVFNVSKARLFSAAIYASVTSNLETVANFAAKDKETHPKLTSVANERKLNRPVDHKFVFLRPLHVDYILLRRGELGVYHGIRYKSEREFLHMAVRFLTNLSDENATRFLALSEQIHPKSQRHVKSREVSPIG